MSKKKCIAMLLAGGQGSRLGLLTKVMAKPAVPFGGKYQDHRLSAVQLRQFRHIDTVGVLTQYQPLELNRYIGSGQPWDLDLHQRRRVRSAALHEGARAANGIAARRTPSIRTSALSSSTIRNTC